MTHHPNTCKICCLHADGLSNSEIASRMGISVKTVRSHNAKQGISTAKTPKRYLFCALIEEGVSPQEAIERVGITADYAAELLRLGGTEPPERTYYGWPDVVTLGDAEHVRRLIAAGGYERLSEKPTRTGPVVCLPLIPFREAA